MLNKEGHCINTFKTEGQIKINGEIWKAITKRPVKKGESVIADFDSKSNSIFIAKSHNLKSK